MRDPRATDLDHLLTRYVPADAREAEYQTAMSTLLRTATDPLAATHYVPGHFTASAFILSPDCDELLLIFHSKFERWLQPGGHIEAEDDSALAAALREAREETGLQALAPVSAALFDIDVHEIAARADKPTHLHFDLRFLLRAEDRTHEAGSDARAARWFACDAIAAVASDESVARAVRKLPAWLRTATR
jgi:8-oxo-dGTP pyrophosphatase MutT (NUDIX family)